jgi:hypothetical protein
MYDPKLGQFTTEDPLAFDAGDPNMRRYVGNSPTNATDPTGLEECRISCPDVKLPQGAEPAYCDDWVFYENVVVLDMPGKTIEDLAFIMRLPPECMIDNIRKGPSRLTHLETVTLLQEPSFDMLACHGKAPDMYQPPAVTNTLQIPVLNISIDTPLVIGDAFDLDPFWEPLTIDEYLCDTPCKPEVCANKAALLGLPWGPYPSSRSCSIAKAGGVIEVPRIPKGIPPEFSIGLNGGVNIDGESDPRFYVGVKGCGPCIGVVIVSPDNETAYSFHFAPLDNVPATLNSCFLYTMSTEGYRAVICGGNTSYSSRFLFSETLRTLEFLDIAVEGYIPSNGCFWGPDDQWYSEELDKPEASR